MRAPHSLGLDNAPRYAYGVAAVLLVTVLFCLTLTTVVIPGLPADARPPLSLLVQLLVFSGAAVILFYLRSSDATAALSVLALALSGMANAGPPGGVAWTGTSGELVSGLAWIAMPFAFPVIALAILYFPVKSGLLARRPWVHAIPWIAAAPMLVIGTSRALHVWGLDALAPVVSRSDANPIVFYGSFSAALAINVLAIVEGLYRYRFNHDANERRRIRMAVYTAVPGVLAYALKDGLPVALALAGAAAPAWPAGVRLVLHALVLLPAFGLVYAVGVQRVLGPRVVLRRSLQYALATRSMTVLALLPVVPLAWMLVRDRSLTLGEIAASRGLVYAVLLGIMFVAFRYRDHARAWLDGHFFREEYDARKILVSLAGRVRFETDPADLAALVVRQVDEALHPERTAFIVDGVEPGRLAAVASLHGEIAPLANESGLVSMLQWSDQPLDVFLQDPRSPLLRLPAADQAWLETSGASLLVPVRGEGLLGVIVLGARRSEEAYTDEDRQLLASIATQVALGFDVARLRRRVDSPAGGDTTRILTPGSRPMMECPACGRCEDSGVERCPSDGAVMHPVPAVPRIVDRKYRIEQLLGRGGMGAVYRARDVRLDRLVAVKVVRADLLGDPDARQRFRREAQIVAGLQHPSIVSIFDYGTFADGGAFLVMELVRGEDLRRVLQREGRIELERGLRILSAVCAAIETAHREGVLHRDLKPENILLPGQGVEAKVLDFGVAKVVRDDGGEQATRASNPALPSQPAARAGIITAAGMIVGTPAYMAPEQLRGLAPDTRCDIFSLGVVAFEMLTGELPFGRGSLADIVLAHARGVPPLPAGHGLPAEIADAIRSALDPEPERRPPSAKALAALLGT